MRKRLSLIVHVAAVTAIPVLLSAAPALAQVTVTACEQIVTDNAALASDLDCTGFPAALTVKQGAVLDLAGFSVSGAPIQCFGSCVIQGPGTTAGVVNSVEDYNNYPGLISIVSATVNGPVGWASKALVTDSTINGSVAAKAIEISSSLVTGTAGYGVYGSKVTLTDTTVSDHAYQGVICKRCSVYGSTISGNGGSGIDCHTTVTAGAYAWRDVGKLKINNSVVTGNGFNLEFIYSDGARAGIRCAQTASIEDTSITANYGLGVHVYGVGQGGNRLVRYHDYGKLFMSGSTVSDNGNAGVRAESDAMVYSSTIVDNGVLGVSADRRLVLDATNVTDNATDPSCATSACPDVYSQRMPTLTNGSTCGTSSGNSALPSGSWGVCALD